MIASSSGQLPQIFFGTARLGTHRDSALAGQANSITLIFYLAGRAGSKKTMAPRNQVAVLDARSATTILRSGSILCKTRRLIFMLR